MGDQTKYREAIKAIFFEGRDPDDIEYTDAEGNQRTLRAPSRHQDPDLSKPLPSEAMEAIQKLKARYGSPAPPSD